MFNALGLINNNISTAPLVANNLLFQGWPEIVRIQKVGSSFQSSCLWIVIIPKGAWKVIPLIRELCAKDALVMWRWIMLSLYLFTGEEQQPTRSWFCPVHLFSYLISLWANCIVMFWAVQAVDVWRNCTSFILNQKIFLLKQLLDVSVLWIKFCALCVL